MVVRTWARCGTLLAFQRSAATPQPSPSAPVEAHTVISVGFRYFCEFPFQVAGWRQLQVRLQVQVSVAGAGVSCRCCHCMSVQQRQPITSACNRLPLHRHVIGCRLVPVAGVGAGVSPRCWCRLQVSVSASGAGVSCRCRCQLQVLLLHARAIMAAYYIGV